MIDWVSAIIPLDHAYIASGAVTKTTVDGEIEWRTHCYNHHLGSFDDKLTYRSEGSPECTTVGRASHLYVTFNPSKFLQGHNVLGSDSLIDLVSDSLVSLFDHLDIHPTDDELLNIKQGNYRVTRLDINYPFSLPIKHDVLSFIRAAEFTAKTRHGRPSMKGGTLYFGKNSRRWSIKMYCKAEEILVKGHTLPEHLNNKNLLVDWVQNKLRVELTLRTKELEKLDLPLARNLTEKVIKKLFSEYIKRIDMNKQIRLTDKLLLELPTRLRSTYTLWKSGEDVTQLLPRATFYRHRKELLEFDVDVTFPMRTDDETDYSNVIPLLRVLEAKPVEVPDWAFEHKLIHCR